jgi:hypothetical protein
MPGNRLRKTSVSIISGNTVTRLSAEAEFLIQIKYLSGFLLLTRLCN